MLLRKMWARRHTERIGYASFVIMGREKPAGGRYDLIHVSISAQIESDPAALGSNVPDGDIEFALASIWDSRSIAHAAPRLN